MEEASAGGMASAVYASVHPPSDRAAIRISIPSHLFHTQNKQDTHGDKRINIPEPPPPLLVFRPTLFTSINELKRHRLSIARPFESKERFVRRELGFRRGALCEPRVVRGIEAGPPVLYDGRTWRGSECFLCLWSTECLQEL